MGALKPRRRRPGGGGVLTQCSRRQRFQSLREQRVEIAREWTRLSRKQQACCSCRRRAHDIDGCVCCRVPEKEGARRIWMPRCCNHVCPRQACGLPRQRSSGGGAGVAQGVGDRWRASSLGSSPRLVFCGPHRRLSSGWLAGAVVRSIVLWSTRLVAYFSSFPLPVSA